MSDASAPAVGFQALGLPAALVTVLADLGYENPTPIQAETIPHLLAGRDLLGQAQTGTGKTAAFALPLLARVDMARAGGPQVLVLTPTRELAIQVAQALRGYGAHLPGLNVLAVYGGQGYAEQLRALKRGVQVVVGTPGRVMDHMRRGTLDLSNLSALVLDEADEMLRMGFIDDVDWILSETPAERQVALFSATLPPAIRAIARRHLRGPAEVTIRARTLTADTIDQRCWIGPDARKLDALTRILEAEDFDAMLVFVRTRTATNEVAQRLSARGHAAVALSGDVPQREREEIVKALKAGRLDILVATDVAARGLDVERVSHVVNFDIPTDPEAYTHRIGRTGRAGRAGAAILFATPREQHLLRAIEKTTRQPIRPMTLPSAAAVNERRVARFAARLDEALTGADLDGYEQVLADYAARTGAPAQRVAAALAHLLHGREPLLMDEPPPPPPRVRPQAPAQRPGAPRRPHRGTPHDANGPAPAMARFRAEVGRQHGAEPGKLMGAIANEAGLNGRQIGRIRIHDEHSIVELPAQLPDTALRVVANAWVCGRQLRLHREGAAPPPLSSRRADRPAGGPPWVKKAPRPGKVRAASA